MVALRLQLKTAPAHCCPAFRLTPLSSDPGPPPSQGRAEKRQASKGSKKSTRGAPKQRNGGVAAATDKLSRQAVLEKLREIPAFGILSQVLW